ncbi:MAG: hypothetical protein R6W75_06300 [Smithellaceae bacterium]
MKNKMYALTLLWVLAVALAGCANPLRMPGGQVIAKPDEFSHVYEAKEIHVLRAVAGVLKEKKIGRNVVVDEKQNRVDSEYVESGDWRTKTAARVVKRNWRECELTLIVTTEKKTKTGWELRRLLGAEQYATFFSVIELRIYEEMAKIK